MASEEENHQKSHALPQLLIIKPPSLFSDYEYKFISKFQLLKAWESPLPIHLFLTTQAHSVKAALSSSSNPITLDILRLLPSLEIVVATTVGLNQIEIPECRRRGISITNAGKVLSEDCADLAVGLLMDVLWKISSGDRFVRSGLWPIEGDFPLGSKLGGKRVGIIGLGSIGLEVAKRLEPFGCIVAYNSRRKKPNISYPFYADLCKLAAESDALIICCTLTDETHHMIDKQVMKALGKNGIIINIGRGALIDEKELVQCLVKGEIGGAGLDVFENEPDVPEELFTLDNVVLSPHRAVYTPESFSDLYDLMVGNLEAFFSNEPLLSPVLDE